MLKLLRTIKIILLCGAIFISTSFTATLSLVYRTAVHPLPLIQSEAIVVMGAAEYAGKPSPVFQRRLDQAANLFQKKLAPLIITTGGVFPGENISEGMVGKKYLESLIGPEFILTETHGRNTRQSLIGVAAIAAQHNIKRIIIVSDGLHLYRSKFIAQRLEFDVATSAADPQIQWTAASLNFLLREVLSSLFERALAI